MGPKTCVQSISSSVDPQKVYQSITDVVFAIDEEGIFQFVSPACLQLFGYTAEEMTGASFLNFIHPDDIEKTLRIGSERTPDRSSSNFENRYIRKDGSIVPVIWSGRWDENAQILYCVARDGSEMIELQQRMLKAQQMARLAHFEYNVPEESFYVSEMFYEICGLNPLKYPKVSAKLFKDLVHPDDRVHVMQEFFNYQRERSNLTEYRIVRPDGMIVFISHQRELVFNKEGQHVKTIGIIQDITNQKIGELALQQSEERFKSLVQNGNDLLGIIDQQGNYTFVGANVQELLGFTVQELIGKNAFDFIHPEDVRDLVHILQEITGPKAVTIKPFRFLDGKGEWRWVESTISNHLENPAIRGYVVNSRDVTEKKQKDDELKKLSLIAQESSSPMLVTNLSNEITWVNDSLLQLSGFSFEEIIGKMPQEVFITEEMDVVFHQQVQKDLQAGRTSTIEARFFSQLGQEYWLFLTFQPIYNDQKELKYFLAIGKDITEKKKAELERLQAEQRFQALVQNGSDLIVVINPKGIFQYVSNNIRTVLGYEPEEMLGQSAFELIHPEDVQKVATELDTLLIDEASAKGVHHRFLHKNGSWIWLESRGVNHQSNSFINGILVNARNITERVMLQQRLDQERRNKQKEIMAAVIKAQEAERSQLGLELHDNVNQVLTTVKLYNEMYLTGYVQDKDLLVKSAQYTQDCINEIRSISKRLSLPTLGEISLQDSITELIRSINLTKRLEITFTPQGINQCTVPDELHLAIYRIVQEGLNNILKYAEAKEAQIEIKRKQKELCVLIADNGKGFDTKAKRKGIGITNMKTRAENLNATFRITSAPGKGCKIEAGFPYDIPEAD